MSGKRPDTSEDENEGPPAKKRMDLNQYEAGLSYNVGTHHFSTPPQAGVIKRTQSAKSQSSVSESGSQSPSSSQSDSESVSSPTHVALGFSYGSITSANENSEEEGTYNNAHVGFQKSTNANQGDSSTECDQKGHSGLDLRKNNLSMSMSSFTSKSNQEETPHRNVVGKMMATMGYQEGKGLGKHAQGRVEPVEASRQRGRRGLGLHIKGLDPASIEWDSSKETVELKEEVRWIVSPVHEGLSRDDMDAWLVKGPRKKTIDDETEFVEPAILTEMLNSKSIFDQLTPVEMRRARTRSNPFETIRGVFFLNRAAVKMGNMDSRLDFMFTSPKLPDGERAVPKGQLLYFADVCAGPGGFSEYVLWRKQWRAKGFGFTLRNKDDFKLHDFLAGPPETFHPYYGVKGDGNVFDPENIASLRKHVLEQTDGKGVHFMMADGGFSVEGKENIQEILSKQLYLCQCLVALSIVRTNGHFVVKLFDLFTPFSVGLVYLMYKSFQEICILKPNTSRPANSERYLICKWKRADSDTVERHLFEVNVMLSKYTTDSTEDINELVPIELMHDEADFFNYIVDSNNSLGRRQIINLSKIAAFYRDETLMEPNQDKIRSQCLELWQIEDKIRKQPFESPSELFCSLADADKLCKDLSLFLKPPTVMINKKDLLGCDLANVYDWHFVPIYSEKYGEGTTLGYYLGLGGNKVYRYENGSWVSMINRFSSSVELPRGTLIYGELVTELRGVLRMQVRLPSLHIIDAIYLGNTNVSRHYLPERIALCETFCRALSSPERVQVRTKTLQPLEKLRTWLEGLEQKSLKNGRPTAACMLPRTDAQQEKMFYTPNGLMFLCATEEPWTRQKSRKTGSMYFFNKSNSKSVYEFPPESFASFLTTLKKRRLWKFASSNMKALFMNNTVVEEGDELRATDFLDFIKSKIRN